MRAVLWQGDAEGELGGMASGRREPRGNISVDIDEGAIEEALRAVERLEAERRQDEEIFDPAAEPEPPTLEPSDPERLALEEENRALRGMVERLQADIEALRRRAQREKEEAERYGVEKLLVELIPVLDNLERAQRHARQGEQGLAEGVEMTHRMFVDALRRFGIESFSALGQPFDPALHEAVELRPTADHPPNTVVEELVRGYRLHDRLVRPAMVCVAAPPVESSQDE